MSRPPAALMIASLFAAVAFVFWPALSADFVQWDDPNMISANPALNPPGWAATAGFWTRPLNKLYMPLTATVWAGVAAIENVPPGQALSPMPYHLLNLLVHAGAAALAFMLLKELVGSPWPAWAGAMIFALHPLQVESVAWASETKDLLFAGFGLAALWLYILHSKGDRRGGWQFPLATVLFGLALLSKSTAVVIPLLAAASDRWMLKKPLKGSLPLLAWAILAIPILVVAHNAQPAIRPAPILWRLPVAIDAIGFYAVKLFAPIHLAIDYERSPHWLMEHSRAAWRGVAVVVPAIVLCMYRRTAWLRAPLALVIFALLPVLGFMTFDFQDYSTVADHYTYLPMFGIALAVALLMRRALKTVYWICLCILLGCLAARSFSQTRVWRDTPALAANQFKIDPDSSTAHKILAEWLVQNGRDAEAEPQFAAAIIALQGEGKRDNGSVWFDYGNLLLRQRRSHDAINAYWQALSAQPRQDQPKTLNNMALAYYQAGDLEQARRSLRSALDMDPNYIEAKKNLARLGGQ
jgi:protein O-mannosyl-transferase